MPEPGCGDRGQGLRRRLKDQGHGVEDPGYDQLQGTAAPRLQQHRLQNVRKAVDHLAARGVEDLSGLTLMSDGVSVYECRSADDVTDLLAGGQGVFGLAVPGLVKDLSATITALDDAGVSSKTPTDELAARRARRRSA